MNYRQIDKLTASHYQWGDHCDSWVLADTDSLSVKQEFMPPGTRERLHFHARSQQFFFILKGTATFYLDDESVVLNEHQSLLIPANTKHFIANETNYSLEFLVTSEPSTNHDRINMED